MDTQFWSEAIEWVKSWNNGDNVEREGVEKWFFWDFTPCGSCKNRRFGGT
jgi:hypothetical protein